MLCKSCIRSVIFQARHIGTFTTRRVKLGNTGRNLHAGFGFTNWWNREFKTSLRMMVDTSMTGKRGPIIDVLPEKDEDGGYASGGWKRLVIFFLIFRRFPYFVVKLMETIRYSYSGMRITILLFALIGFVFAAS